MTTIRNEHLSPEELDRAVLLAACGCNEEDVKLGRFTYSGPQNCVLMRQALARKILGLDGVFIGMDPRRNYCGEKRDYASERAQVPLRHPNRLAHLRGLAEAEERDASIDAGFDSHAWGVLIELEERIDHSAKRLERAGLAFTDIDTMTPADVATWDKNSGGSGAIPIPGTIQASPAGFKVVKSGLRLKKVDNPKRDTIDYDVEIAA